MNADQSKVMRQCAEGALSGELTFPEIIGRLRGGSRSPV